MIFWTHYGAQTHHIGDQDGIPEDRAAILREWWKQELILLSNAR